MDAHLILYHRIANILNHTPEFIRVLDIVEKARNVSLFFQWRQISTSAFQFPGNPRT